MNGLHKSKVPTTNMYNNRDGLSIYVCMYLVVWTWVTCVGEL